MISRWNLHWLNAKYSVYRDGKIVKLYDKKPNDGDIAAVEEGEVYKYLRYKQSKLMY